MPDVATARVVAEFYRGIDFPPDWADNPTATITAGLAHERMASVIVLINKDEQPLAACWQLDGCDEKFVRIGADGAAPDNLLAGLDDDLAYQSRRDTGHADLYATLLWEPESLQPDQGIDVRPPPSGSWFDPNAYERGWSVATGELVAKASNLLLVTRKNTTGLSLPVPANAAEMHQDVGDDGGTTIVVLPTPSVV